MEDTAFSPVPWYKYSGGVISFKFNSTWIECPWLALILVPSSLKENRCLLLPATTLFKISLVILKLCLFILLISSATSAQPFSLIFNPIASGLWRNTRLRNLLILVVS